MKTKTDTLLQRYTVALTTKDAHGLELCRHIEEELAEVGIHAELEGKKLLRAHIEQVIKELETEGGQPGLVDIYEETLLELSDFIGYHEDQLATN